MQTLNWKLKIVVLWIIAAEAMSAHMILVAVDPGPMEKMLEWGATINGEGWVFGAIYWLIPLVMCYVTIAAKGPSNRWANFILGIICTILNIYHFFMCGVPLSFIPAGPLSEPTAHHILLVGISVLAVALVPWYAWKWPKQEI